MAAVLALAALGVGAWMWTSFQNIFATMHATNDFFRTNANAGPAAAWSQAAPRFRNLPLASWDAQSRALGLANFYSGDWDPPQVDGRHALLNGRLRLLNGGDVRAAIDLEKGPDGRWRVSDALLSGAAGVQAAPYPVSPSPAQPYVASPPAAAAPPTGDPTVQPIAPVTDAPTYAAPPSTTPTLGRAGPPGAYLPEGPISVQCLSPMARLGFHADRIDCGFSRMATVPGTKGYCTGYSNDGRRMNATITFLDYDPVTREGRFDCTPNP